MKPDIFKAYDIRGLSPQDLNPEDAKRIAGAIVKIFKPTKVVMGRDMRETSEALEAGLVEGFLSLGVNVTKIGLCSTPVFNFAIGSSKAAYDLGVMVTASHNPAEYNGFKITKGDNLPIGQGSGMEDVRALALSDENFGEASSRGELSNDNNVLQRYVAYVIEHAGLPSTEELNLKIAVDAGNGMEGLVLPVLAQELSGMKFESLYWELDGRFPNHEANPLKLETLKTLQQKVVQSKCAFGAAFDGDADRVGIVDETGEPIPGSILTALLAQEILREHSGGHILYDLRSSTSVEEAVKAAGGTAEMTRVGHAFIKAKMKDTGAVFAGELSMHFYFQDFWNCEAGDYAMLLILRLLLREGKPLSALWRPLLRYSHSGEINFEIKDPQAAIETIASDFSDEQPRTGRLDGLRLEFKDYWLNVRASNTEPLLRLNTESPSAEKTGATVDRVTEIIEKLGGNRV